MPAERIDESDKFVGKVTMQQAGGRKLTSRSPRERLRVALMRVGEGVHVPEADLRSAVETALCELAEEVLGKRSCVGLVTVGSEEGNRGRSVGLRLADYDVGLPDLLWYAGESALPPQVRESCPTLVQDEWEAVLLVSKLIVGVLESEPARVPDGAAQHPERLPRPAGAVAGESFCRALATIAECSELHQDELATQLRTALLGFASETPDNLEAARHIAVRRTEQTPHAARVCLSRSGLSFAQVLLSADGGFVPDEVLDEFPELTQDEWNAVVQAAGLTLLAFEAEPTHPAG